MARGMFTALQAALAGISGGATGYAKYQQQEQERKRQMKEEERAALRDALLQSQFGLQEQEFKAKYGPEAIARQEQERKDALANQLKAAQISAGAAAQRDAAERAAQAKELQKTAEAWWNQTVIPKGQTGTPAQIEAAARAAQTFNRLRAANPNAPARELISSVYTAESGREAQNVKRAQADMPLIGESTVPGGGATGYNRATPTTGGSYGSTSTKQPITRREYYALKSQGYSDAQLSARYEVTG
jgi:membrane protein involved in colicin uptake